MISFAFVFTEYFIELFHELGEALGVALAFYFLSNIFPISFHSYHHKPSLKFLSEQNYTSLMSTRKYLLQNESHFGTVLSMPTYRKHCTPFLAGKPQQKRPYVPPTQARLIRSYQGTSVMYVHWRGLIVLDTSSG